MTDTAEPLEPSDESAEETPEARQERREEARRLAAATRRVIDGLVTTRAPADGLSEAAVRLEGLAEWLKTYPKGARYEGFAEAVNAGDPQAFFDHSPLMGRANPLAPPLEMRPMGDDGVEGTVVFGTAYEGPPGCVHGGIIAAAFDDVLGLANTFTGLPGMTGTLTVKYRSPTPLHTELTFRGRIERRDGRKTIATGTCHAGDRLCSEAEAIFIAINPDKFRALMEQRAAQQAGQIAD